MGSISSCFKGGKAKTKDLKEKWSEKDKAMVQIKSQRDSLSKRRKDLDKIIIEEKEKAMVFFQKGEKDQAASKMKERKLHIEQRTAVSNMYDKLQEIIGQIDQQQDNVDFYRTMEVADQIATSLSKDINPEQLQQLTDHIEEQFGRNDEFNQVVHGFISNVKDYSDEDIEAELAQKYGQPVVQVQVPTNPIVPVGPIQQVQEEQLEAEYA